MPPSLHKGRKLEVKGVPEYQFTLFGHDKILIQQGTKQLEKGRKGFWQAKLTNAKYLALGKIRKKNEMCLPKSKPINIFIRVKAANPIGVGRKRGERKPR